MVTTTAAEREARQVAAAFPTPNALRAIALAESGRLLWGPVRDLLVAAVAEAVEVVA